MKLSCNRHHPFFESFIRHTALSKNRLRHTSGRGALLTLDAIWLLASVGSIVFLVPLNTRVADGDADWQRIHRIWDKRHRVRTAALAIAAVLFAYVVVR